MQVTPMDFTNAVAEAQRRMLAVTGDMFPEKCEPYIDDNPVKGARYKDETEVEPGVRKFVWDHLQDIKDLLQRFLLYNITASGPKSILAVPEVTILRFRCGAYGRRPDPAKTDKISQWPTPLRTMTEVRAFLGVVGFWRIFIKDFAKIAEPIRAMIREGGTMDWTEDREEAAQTLKDILSSDQVTLAAPCFNDEVGRPFILETDGGPLTVGGVLIQRSEEGKERPIRFESRTLNSAERRYSQFKKEVLAILHCLKTFQAYLFGTRFILRIDPTNVVGALKNYKPIDPTVGRWIGFIWQFDYKVERIAGLRNRADGLSRVCITLERVEDAEPVDVFLEYEGGTLVVDNEMTDPAITTGPGKEQTTTGKMEFGNENDSNAINRPTEGQSLRQAGESSSRKRKLYVGFDHNLVLNRGGRKQGTRGPSPLKEGEPIELPSESDPSSEEEGNPEEGQRPGENEPVEFIDLTSDEEEDEVTTPTREERGRREQPGEKKDKWIKEFGYEFSDRFDQWGTILRYQWIMKAREKLGRGEDLSPTTFFTEQTLLQFQGVKRQME
ncbi:hypothetical protein CBR_g38585 [Chara braunii]|nr:hypothetical protein CBR_g38585 [Chara braunii]|eukprot:GBG63517.1 hypothetical protein CBR_g38585 [Chara braunii]